MTVTTPPPTGVAPDGDDRPPIIRVEGLGKTFQVTRRRAGRLGALRGLGSRSSDAVSAVEGVSFTVQPGEMVGYIGPNGAGKSTTIKMLTGILNPTAGEATVDGLVPWRQRKRLAGRIGVVFGQRTQLWWDLPLIDSLDLLRHVYRVPADRFRANLDRFRELLDLDPFLATPVRQLSLGQRMRGDLAAALLHDPPILYLDEPTIGLDVIAKARVLDFLAAVNRDRGVTVLLTTHDMDDIEKLCRRLMILDHGRLVYDGELATIRDRFGTHRTLVVDLDLDLELDRGAGDGLAGPHPADPLADLGLPGVETVRIDGPRRWVRFDRSLVSAAEVIAAVVARTHVSDLRVEEPSIEAIIRHIYERGVGADAPAGVPPKVPAGTADGPT